MKRSLSILLVCFFVSCGTMTYNGKKSDHFNGEKFFNPSIPGYTKSLKDLLKWRFFTDKEKWPDWIESKQKKVQYQKANQGELIVTFVNHATFLIQIDGVNILTDPVWAERTSPVSFAGPKRHRLPGIKLIDLPKIDLVIISHNHYDHMDVETLKHINKRDNPLYIVGLNNAHYLHEVGIDKIKELDWNQSLTFKGLRIDFLECMHWSRRTLFDTNKSLWGSFVIEGSKRVYFAGDTGWGDHFKAQGKKYKSFDLSLIPIGAYEPRWFMKQFHINPDESVKAHQHLNSKFSIGMHFGTFQLTNEALNDPVIDLELALDKHKVNEKNFIVMKEGDHLKIQ